VEWADCGARSTRKLHRRQRARDGRAPAGDVKRGAGIAGTPLALPNGVGRPTRYDRGFAVRPSDEPPDDEPPDDDPDDEDPLDCEGVGDGDELCRGRSCAVPVDVPPVGCV